MLKYQVNIKNAEVAYEKLAEYGNSSYSACTFVQEPENGTVLMFLPNGICSRIFENDILSFYRKDGTFIEYNDERFVKESDIISGDTYVKFVQFPQQIFLKIEETERKIIEGETYVLFTFNREHYFDSREKPIKKNVLNEEDFEELCIGDYFVKNDYFIFEKINSESAVCINSQCHLSWVNPIRGEKHADGIVPCLLDGSEMKSTLMFRYLDVKDLYENYKSFMCWIKDNRFFKYNEEFLELRPGTSVRLRKGDINVSFGADNVVSPYILSEDGVKQYLEDKAKTNVNEPIDYEKQQFSPVVYSDDTLFFVNKITFYIHLRERDENWNVIPEGEWAGYGNCAEGSDRCFNYVDNVLGNYDFTEEDIYYQRKCVSETFLRISFYDRRDRGKQKLLYTAKLYLDENRLWSEYVNQKNNYKIYIPFLFTCTNKYDYNNKTEGFYLHLFQGDVKEPGVHRIFMKAELCHAKYGKTIPLTMPFISYNDDWRGKNYLGLDASGKIFTDMAELNKDMYPEINLKYDEESKQFVWFFEGAKEEEDAENLEIHLYEPKMF